MFSQLSCHNIVSLFVYALRACVYRRLEFKCATEWQKFHLFTSFYTEDPSLHGSGVTSDALAAQAELFCRRLAGVDVSMAALQGYLMRFKGDPEGAVQNCDMHFVRPPTTAQSPSSSS
jgi:hypothetical protein